MSKTALEKSVDALVDKAADGFDLAKEQRASADKQQAAVDQQHNSAHKLEELSRALVDDAVEIKGEMAMEKVAASRHLPRPPPAKS